MDREEMVFETGGGKSTAAQVMLVICCLLSAVLLLLCIMVIQLIPRQEMNLEEFSSLIDWAYVAFSLFTILWSIAYVTSSIPFCMWFYRAYKNMRGLGYSTTTFKPGWAPGSFFIPIVNLYRPYQIAKEIWEDSDPETDTDTSLVSYWWAAYLVAATITNIAGNMLPDDVPSPDLRSALFVDAAGHLVYIAAGILALMLVRGIDSRQETMRQAYLENSFSERISEL